MARDYRNAAKKYSLCFFCVFSFIILEAELLLIHKCYVQSYWRQHELGTENLKLTDSPNLLKANDIVSNRNHIKIKKPTHKTHFLFLPQQISRKKCKSVSPAPQPLNLPMMAILRNLCS